MKKMMRAAIGISLLLSVAMVQAQAVTFGSALGASRIAVQAAQQYAAKLGLCVSVAVSDTSGTLIALERQDCALPVNSEYAAMKAATASTLGVSTKSLQSDAQPGKPLYGIESSTIAGKKITLLEGGVPILVDDKLVGAIGVGSTVVKREANERNGVDNKIAEVARDAFIKAYAMPKLQSIHSR